MTELLSPRRFRLAAFAPRFGLRAMLVAVFLIAVSIPLSQTAWRRFVLDREGREYSALQATKDSYVQEQRERRAEPGSTSFAVDESRPMPDDYVVLVRRGNSFGCFIPRNQHKKGESLEYDWYYRTDGLAQFSPEDPHVRSGHSFAGPYISGSGPFVTVAFGPFTIEWSGNGPGWGLLYYFSRRNSDANPADQLRIRTTNCKTVEYFDGRSAEWIYKASVGDVGLPGNVDAARRFDMRSR